MLHWKHLEQKLRIKIWKYNHQMSWAFCISGRSPPPSDMMTCNLQKVRPPDGGCYSKSEIKSNPPPHQWTRERFPRQTPGHKFQPPRMQPSSSGDVFLRQAGVVPCSQFLVHNCDVTVDEWPHVRGKRVEVGLTGPRAFEMAVFVIFSTEQMFLTAADIEKGDDVMKSDYQRCLQVLVMNHQQLPAETEPVEYVGHPPGGVTAYKLWPLWKHKRTKRLNNVQQRFLQLWWRIYFHIYILFPLSAHDFIQSDLKHWKLRAFLWGPTMATQWYWSLNRWRSVL